MYTLQRMTASPALTLSDVIILKLLLDNPVIYVLKYWHQGFKDPCGLIHSATAADQRASSDANVSACQNLLRAGLRRRTTGRGLNLLVSVRVHANSLVLRQRLLLAEPSTTERRAIAIIRGSQNGPLGSSFRDQSRNP
jgi:hypothetical protein